MIAMGRKLDDDDKIQMSSVPEIKDGMVATATRLSRKVRFKNRKLRPGPLMNAVFLWYLTRPEETQEEIAREFVGRLEGILEEDTPVVLTPDTSEPVAEGKKSVRETRAAAAELKRSAKSS